MKERTVPTIAEETGRAVVHPWLCDAMGHLATQHYMRFYDDAFFHLFAKLGPVVVETAERRVGWADVRHEVLYLQELQAGDLVVLRSAVVKIGRSSLTHRTYISRVSDNVVCSTLESTTVRFDLEARRSIEIEPQIRESAHALLIA
ncbi:MAG: acyl-CoA thioesterase [Sphingomonadales bacterium]|nr:MAG: acyl-CoA thioesterase [Sphingomonadales bacterium]TNF03726.1 MAG: acyl-CoA thioesterase [Sphingomonadales bacterium]